MLQFHCKLNHEFCGITLTSYSDSALEKGGKENLPSPPPIFSIDIQSRPVKKKNLTIYYGKISFVFQSFSYTLSELPKQSFLIVLEKRSIYQLTSPNRNIFAFCFHHDGGEGHSHWNGIKVGRMGSHC